MATDHQARLYATLRNTNELLNVYRSGELSALTHFTRELLRDAGSVPQTLVMGIRAVSAPSLDWEPKIVGYDGPLEIVPAELVIAYSFDDTKTAEAFIDFVIFNRGRPLHNGNAFLDVGTDPGGSVADHWCPEAVNRPIFGHRAAARQLVNADALRGHGLTGNNVNVVLIDQGLNKQAIMAKNWGGGFGPHVGLAERTSHGMMIARNILDLAPDAVLYDVPMIPPRITNLPAFASTAHVIIQITRILIQLLRPLPRWSGPWILVNAWAILDRDTDQPPFGSYTENNAIGGHPLIKQVRDAVQLNRVDAIFAAGNCGEFCPNKRCGALDRGPGHSIWGANALPTVITTGAVRTDETWLGYSSQGPGPGINGLDRNKPDLCAPS